VAFPDRIERTVEIAHPPAEVWAALTTAEGLSAWFGKDARIDLRPGGIFRTVMRGPEGQEINNIGCFLEIMPSRKLVWTIALRPGYRPADPSFDVPAFTAIVRMEPHGTGTKYSALAIHKDEESRNRHERMGFSEGWGRSLDQLVAHAKTMQAAR